MYKHYPNSLREDGSFTKEDIRRGLIALHTDYECNQSRNSGDTVETVLNAEPQVVCDDCGSELFFKQEGNKIRIMACQTCIDNAYDVGATCI